MKIVLYFVIGLNLALAMMNILNGRYDLLPWNLLGALPPYLALFFKK